MARGLKLRGVRNADFQRAVTVTAEGQAYPLTGWSGEMNVYAEAGASPLLTITETPTANGSVLTFTDAANGVFEFLIAQGDVEALPEASPATDPAFFVYDVMLTDPTDLTSRFLGGVLMIDAAGGGGGATYGDSLDVEVNGQEVHVELEVGSSRVAVEAAQAAQAAQAEAEAVLEAMRVEGAAVADLSNVEVSDFYTKGVAAGLAQADLGNVLATVLAAAPIQATDEPAPLSVNDRVQLQRVNMRRLGVPADGVTSALSLINSIMTAGGAKEYYFPAGDYLVQGYVDVPSGAGITLAVGANLIEPGIRVRGSVGSEINLTAPVAAGDQALPIDTTGLAAGDWLYVKGCTNLFSSDAAERQCGFSSPSDTDGIYDAEFVRVTAVSVGSAEIRMGLQNPYVLVAGAASLTRTTSTARKVNFSEGGWIKGGTITGCYSATNEVIRREWTRGHLVEDVTFEIGASAVHAVADYENTLSSRQFGNTVRRRVYTVGDASLRNSFLTYGAHDWVGEDNTVDGGNQACDFSYRSGGARSVNCVWNRNHVYNAFEVGTTHQGSLACQMDDNHGFEVVRGIRLRGVRCTANRNQLRNRNVASGFSGIGVFISEGFVDGSQATGNIVEGFLYGVQVNWSNVNGTLPAYDVSVLVAHNDVTYCEDGYSVTGATASNKLRAAILVDNVARYPTKRGCHVDSYSNGTEVDGLRVYGPIGASARAGIEWSKNTSRLAISNPRFHDLGSMYGLRGPGTAVAIDDTTTFPGGSADAKWVIEGARYFGHTASWETTGIFRGVTPFASAGYNDYGVRERRGKLVLRQDTGTTGDFLEGRDAASTRIIGISETGWAMRNSGGTLIWLLDNTGKLAGSVPASVKAAVAAATDVATLKTALAGLFA